VAEMPQTGGSGDSPGGNGGNALHSQMSAETVQGRDEVGKSRQHFATLRAEAPDTFTGKHVQLEDWIEAVHIYLALYGNADDKIMYMVVNQFLSADIKTWVKTLHIDSWVRLQKELIEYYVDPVAPWNLFATLCRTMDGPCISFMAVSCTLSLRLFFMCRFSFSCCQYLVLDVIPLFNVDCHRLRSGRVAEGLLP
jgi:hypothetical protein